MLNAEWRRSAFGLILGCALLTAGSGARPAVSLTWNDLPPAVRDTLGAAGLSQTGFSDYIAKLHRVHAERVREGDLDHLVFYLLQSTHFTRQRPIEPALSARALVDAMPPRDRDAYLQQRSSDISRVPPAVRTRARGLLRALDSRDQDPRVGYFRQLAAAVLPHGPERESALLAEYVRAMRFLYQKEFVAQRAPDAADAVASLYRSRGLSTDTAVEAGYLVHLGLGVLKSLEPDRRVRRVLIVGPGLDLAPRTALIDAAPPESYQPWAVIDALVGLGLARLDDLEVVGGDINPRVVDYLRRVRAAPPSLTLVSGIQESPVLTIAQDYRDYFRELGRSIGHATDGSRGDAAGRLRKTVVVGPPAAHTLTAETLDVVTESLDGPPFDLVIATNILPYFDDVELTLAMSNIARMLAPGGVFLHNEARPLMHEVTAALGMPVEQSRHAIIASVKGAAAPLFDSVWLHRKAVR
jgi:SAM-dependent methyltransferase